MRSPFLDRYYKGTSLVHRLDPRLKLLATLVFILVATSLPPSAWPAFLLLAVLALGAIRLAEIPLSEGLKRSSIALPFVGMVAVSLPFTQGGQVIWRGDPLGLNLAITAEGLVHFASVLVKSWLSVLVSGLLVATTPLPELLKAMRSLHIPGALTATISFMVRYLFVLVDEAMRLHTAREARSAGPGGTIWWRAKVLGGMVGSLFIRSYERSEHIYIAMVSRGFAGEIRTLRPLTWQRRDSWAGLGWITILAAIAIVGYSI
ncbi:MAG: cobalt ECF transporter T component CbiQ [Anaerolineae bacterium]